MVRAFGNRKFVESRLEDCEIGVCDNGFIMKSNNIDANCSGWFEELWFVVEDFRLMRICRHFINGNSTFSWWVACFGEQTDSIFVSPANDELSNRYFYSRDLIPSRWNAFSWS